MVDPLIILGGDLMPSDRLVVQRRASDDYVLRIGLEALVLLLQFLQSYEGRR